MIKHILTKLSIITVSALCSAMFLVSTAHAAAAPKIKSIKLSPVLAPAQLEQVKGYKVSCSGLLDKFSGTPSFNSDSDIDSFIQTKNITLSPRETKFPGITSADFLSLKVAGCAMLASAKADQSDYQAKTGSADFYSHITGPFRNYYMRAEINTNSFLVYPSIDGVSYKPVNNSLFSVKKSSLVVYHDKSFVYVQVTTGKEPSIIFRISGLKSADLKVAEADRGEAELLWDNKTVFLIVNAKVWRVAGADAASFDPNSAIFWAFQDKNRIYEYDGDSKQLYAAPVAGATYAENEFGVGQREFYDAKYDYYLVPKRVIAVDRQAVTRVYSNVFKDKDAVYQLDLIKGSFAVVPGVDAATFIAAPTLGRQVVFKDKKNFYYLNPKLQLQKLGTLDGTASIDGVDGVVTEGGPWLDVSGKVYVLPSDNWSGYGNGFSPILIKQADVRSMKVLYNEPGLSIAKDKKNVYAAVNAAYVTIPADAATFEMVQVGGGIAYGKDKNHIFVATRKIYTPRILENADPNTFYVKKSGAWYYFGVDASSVWFYNNDTDEIELVKGAQPATFDFDTYVKTKTILNSRAAPSGMDTPSLRKIADCLLTDGKGVWLKDSSDQLLKIENADPNTIKVGDFVYDKQYAWPTSCGGATAVPMETRIDITSMQPLAYRLFTDKNSVWFYDNLGHIFQQVNEIDRNSVSLVSVDTNSRSKAVLKDKNHVWTFSVTPEGSARIAYSDSIDVNSFVPLFTDTKYFYKDANGVYSMDWGCYQWPNGHPIGNSGNLGKIDGAAAQNATWSQDNNANSCMPVLRANGDNYYFNENTFSYEKK